MLRFFTSDLRRNLTKILCLTIGLSVGFLLVAKIYFEQTYDSFLPDADRIYRITESVVEHGEYKEYPHTPGGTAHELRRNIPQIEKATRTTEITGNTVIKLDDGRMFEVVNITLADTCLFDVLSTPILEGNPHELLAGQNYVMIPQSLAEKIGGDVIGMQVTNVGFGDDLKMIIGGIYQDYPLNSTIDNSVYIGMSNLEKFMWNGSENLIGNDRYTSYAMLAKGVKPDEILPNIQSHIKKKIPEEAFTISDYKLWLRPLHGFYSSNKNVRMMSWMLGLLALVMLMCTGLNYLLIVIGQLAARGKEMAIRKCYGTGQGKIFLRVFRESLFFIAISMILAILLSFSLSNLCRQLLGYSPQQLLSTERVWIVEGCVCIILLIITAVTPAIIYSRTPVAHAFHPSIRGKKGWKLALLALQFFATGLIMCLLVLVVRQYYMVGNLKMGLDYENIGYFYRNDLSEERTSTVITELMKLPFVEGVATADRILSDYGSGNMMWIEGQYENQVNIGDMGFINPEIIDVMGIKFLQGGNFSEYADSTANEIIVEERLIELLHNCFNDDDTDIIGKRIIVTGHESEEGNLAEQTIVGVIENIRRGGIETGTADKRAGIIFPTRRKTDCIYVRFTELNPENLKETQRVIDSLKDSSAIYITPYKSQIEAKRDPIRRFGTAVIVVGIAIFIIALIGLIGYVSDEVNRRSKEIAIRKVNGTSAKKIIELFCTDILKIAIPSLVAGGATAMIIGHHWLSQFTDRVTLSPWSMAVCLIMLLIVIIAVVIINCLRISRTNPVNHLRSE